MNKTKQLTLNAILAAMCAVLGFVAVDLTAIKITFESVPVIMAGLLFGPLSGLAVGGIGTLIYQLLRYGVSATTLLWIAPYAICGFLVGWYAKKKAFAPSQKEVLLCIIWNELLITLLNTGAMYIDSKMYGYWFPGFISAGLSVRLAVCMVKAVAYGYVVPYLVRALDKNVHITGRRAV